MPPVEAGRERVPLLSGSRRYRVIVGYREPVFELIIGRIGPPYEVVYMVEAPDPGAARERALEGFESTWRVSGAHWSRSVVSVAVHESDG